MILVWKILTNRFCMAKKLGALSQIWWPAGTYLPSSDVVVVYSSLFLCLQRGAEKEERRGRERIKPGRLICYLCEDDGTTGEVIGRVCFGVSYPLWESFYFIFFW